MAGGGLQQLITNIAALLSTQIGAGLVFIFIVLGAIYTAWHNHYGWLITIVLMGTFILGAAWYENAFYGVSAGIGG